MPALLARLSSRLNSPVSSLNDSHIHMLYFPRSRPFQAAFDLNWEITESAISVVTFLARREVNGESSAFICSRARSLSPKALADTNDKRRKRQGALAIAFHRGIEATMLWRGSVTRGS